MKIEFSVGPTARTGKILLDGVDVSKHVRAVTFTADVNAATSARLELVNIDVTIDGMGIVEGVVIPLIVEPGVEDVTGLGDQHRRYKPGDAA